MTTKILDFPRLRFSFGNSKLPPFIGIFELPAGHTCPGADICLSKAHRTTGKITDGIACQFRCYAASQESAYPSLRKKRWHNFSSLRGKTKEEMLSLILLSLPQTPILRIHASGDFFSQDYFDVWVEVAKQNPQILFYAYTKALPFWVKHLGNIPSNFKLIASVGGKYDHMIKQYFLRFAQVVYSEEDAQAMGLAIDTDDSIAYSGTESFALLLHGTQPAKSVASKAWQKIKTTKGGYGKKHKGRSPQTAYGNNVLNFIGNRASCSV